MKWLSRRKKATVVPLKPKEYIDMERDSIPMNDEDDATSLLFILAMTDGPVACTEETPGDWVVMTQKGEFHGHTQLAALKAARAAESADG